MRRWLLVLLTFSMVAQEETFSLALHQGFQEIKTKVDSVIKNPFTVADISFSSNNGFSEEEFFYTVPFVKGETITPEQLATALSLLLKKEAFKTITVTVQKLIAGYGLHFRLEADWVLGAISFSGIALGKNKYLQYYDMSSGQVFSQEKHEASLKKITEVFAQKGYKEVVLKDSLIYHKPTKTVRVKISCQKGKLFSIGSVSCLVIDKNKNRKKRVEQIIEERFLSRLSGKSYHEQTLIDATKEIETFLSHRGYLKSTIKLQETSNTQTKKVTLFFSIQVGKRRQVTFVGNHFFSATQLREQILKFGDSVQMLPASLLAQDMIAEYRKKGFWNVKIETHEQKEGNFFVIHEGPRSTIKKIILKGVEKYKSAMLSRRFFSPLSKARFFDEKQIKQGLNALVAFYRKQGFWDCVVLKKQYEPITQTEHTLVVTLDEGKQRLLSKIIIEGHSELLSKGPFAKYKQCTHPILFDKAILTQQQQWLAEQFKKKGYLWVKVEYELEEKGQEVTVTWKIEKGQQVVFGKTIVQGAPGVHHATLIAQLPYQEGEPWKKEMLYYTHNRFRALDVFKSIRVVPDQKGADPLRKDVIVQLQDDDPFEIQTRFGFQQVSKNFALKKGSTYKIGTAFLWRNPTRRADKLQLSVDVTRFERKSSFSYHLPSFLSSSLTAVFKGYANKYTQPFALGSQKTLYDVVQQGAMMSLTHHGSVLSAGINTGFEWMQTKNLSQNLATAINFKAELVGKKMPYYFVEPSFFIDLLDDKINPTKGLFFVGSLKGMFPLKTGATYLLKFLVEKGMFFPIKKNTNVIVGTRIRFGHIFKESFSSIMPPERFYLGGAHSLRGYLPDSCPPLGTFMDGAETQRVPQGGKSMLNMNLEIRIPLLDKFSWVLFQDFGVLVEDIIDINAGKNNLASSGFGFRYMTPIGPLRFDIGWKWQKPFPEDSGYAWFLTFGHAF